MNEEFTQSDLMNFVSPSYHFRSWLGEVSNTRITIFEQLKQPTKCNVLKHVSHKSLSLSLHDGFQYFIPVGQRQGRGRGPAEWEGMLGEGGNVLRIIATQT